MFPHWRRFCFVRIRGAPPGVSVLTPLSGITHAPVDSKPMLGGECRDLLLGSVTEGPLATGRGSANVVSRSTAAASFSEAFP